MSPAASNFDAGLEPIRLLICDDYFLIREGLKAVVTGAPDLEVVAEADNAEDAIRLVADMLPDVVIMDVMLPGMNGMEATRLIKDSHPSVAVVVLTRFDDSEHILQIYRAGASAYMVKAVRAEELLTTLRAVANGGVVLHPHVADAVIQSFSRSQEAPSIPNRARLSTREMEVLRLVARGLSNKEIARELGISLRTAQNHIANIFHKLELNDRVSAAVYAVQQGLATPEEVSPSMIPS